MAVWAGSWRMGVVSPGKGMVRVKSKLVKRTLHIPRLRGGSTKWLGEGMVGEQGTGRSKEHKEDPWKQSQWLCELRGRVSLQGKQHAERHEDTKPSGPMTHPGNGISSYLAKVGRTQAMLKQQAEDWLWRTLWAKIKHLNFIPKEMENWSILKKRSDNRTDFKKNYSGNTLRASRLIR